MILAHHVKPPPAPPYALLAQFIGMGRVMTRRRSLSDFGFSSDAAMSWFDPLFRVLQETRSSDTMRRSPPLAPAFHRRRRKKRVENIGPSKPRRGRRLVHFGRCENPEEQRRRAIRVAWAMRDWWTLKAFGEIDEIPEP